MLACGSLGGWYAYRALTDRQFTWRVTVVSAVLLVLAQEFHGVGQLFLAAPLLTAVFVDQPLASAISGMPSPSMSWASA